MAWYEKSSKGHRARFAVPGKSAGAGPVFPTREEARTWAIAHGHERPDIDTLADLITRWRAVKLSEKRCMPSYALEVERDLLNVAKARKWTGIRDVTMESLDQWKVETNGKGTSRQISMLLSVLRWGHRQYGLPIDERVRKHPTPRSVRKVMADALLTDEQVSALVEAAGEHGPSVSALIHYLSTYGARPVTACTRTIADVDFTRGSMLVDGKRSGQWRHAILPETLAFFAAATAGRPLTDPLFLDPRTGKGWALNWQHSAAQLCAWYTRTLGRKLCGPSLSGIYDLKRYAITRMLRKGIDAPTVAKFTGHLTLSQVLQYARGNETTTRNVLELLCVEPNTQTTQKSAGSKSHKRLA